MFILEVGDMGFYNISIDTHKRISYIIDYYETRTNIHYDELFYFSKRSAAAKTSFGSILSTILQCYYKWIEYSVK